MPTLVELYNISLAVRGNLTTFVSYFGFTINAWYWSITDDTSHTNAAYLYRLNSTVRGFGYMTETYQSARCVWSK
jgi:hypothetical protein